MRITARHLFMFTGLALAATSLSAVPASAAPPTDLEDSTYTEVICQGTVGDLKLTVRAQLFGTYGSSAVQVATMDGESIGSNFDGTSDWTDSTFRASIPVLDYGEDGEEPKEVALVYFAGSYGEAGPGSTDRSHNTIAQGNTRLQSWQTSESLDYTIESLTYDNADVAISRCDASRETSHVMTTNPLTRVVTWTSFENCETTGSDFYIEREFGGLNPSEIYAELTSIDGMTSTSGVVDFNGGTMWSGEFRISDDEGSETRVPASAVRERVSSDLLVDQPTGRHNQVRETTYDMSLSVVLSETETVTLSCDMVEHRLALRNFE